MDNYTATEEACKKGYEAGKPKWIPVTERLPEDDLPKDSEIKTIKVLVHYRTSLGVPVVRTQIRKKDRCYHKGEWS